MITQQVRRSPPNGRRKPQLIPKQVQKAIAGHHNLKHRLIGLIMLRCGARPGEAAQIQIKDLDLQEGRIVLHTLKRKDGHTRAVKMTSDLIETLAAYWENLKDKRPNAYLFPPTQKLSRKKHIQPKQISRYFKKHFHINPHRCRHTFASRVLREVKDVYQVKELLGHKSVANTEIYLHVPQLTLDAAIQATDKLSLSQRLRQIFIPKKPAFFMPVEQGLTQFHIGRQEELAKLVELVNKKVNVLLVGEHGTGKTHLLQNIPDTKKNILRIDDLTSTKRSLQGLVLELFSRKPELFEIMFAHRFEREGLLEIDKEMTQVLGEELMRQKEAIIGKVISRNSIHNLVDLCTKVCQPLEYTIIIDDITRLGKPGVQAMEKLKNHFHLIVACRQLKIDYQTAVSNFQRIDLKNLARHEAIDLIQKLSEPILERIEDYELFKNHIWEQTAGNPLFIYELIDRYKKEGHITTEITREINHTSGIKETDLFPLVVGLIACLSALRYMARATGGDSGPFYLIAGIGMIFLFFGRSLMRAGKRKWV